MNFIQKFFHTHPINIIENTSKYLVLLLIPLVRALFATQEGFQVWLYGAWFDISIICVILSLAVYRWYRFVFYYSSEGLYIKKGVIIKQTRYISYSKLSSIYIEKPFYFVPFKAVRIHLDTDGGGNKKSDFYMTVKEKTAFNLLEKAEKQFIGENKIKKKYVPNNFYIAVFSFINSNTLTGVIYLALSISKISDIFGEEYGDLLIDSFSKLTSFFSFGLPPIAVYVGYGLVFCWLVSFFINMIKHFRFETSRQGDIINIKSGVITKRLFSIIVPRINYIVIRQSLITRMLGFYSVDIQCTGYGKRKNENSVIFPSGERTAIRSNLKLLLPKMAIAKRQIKPKKRCITRFLFMPLLCISVLLILSFIARYFIKGFEDTIIMLSFICLIPIVWWLFIRIFSFTFTGIGVVGDIYTLYYTKGFQIVTCSIPKEKIVKVVEYQSLLQRRKKACNLIFYSYAEGIKKHKIPNISVEDVREFIGKQL